MIDYNLFMGIAIGLVALNAFMLLSLHHSIKRLTQAKWELILEMIARQDGVPSKQLRSDEAGQATGTTREKP